MTAVGFVGHANGASAPFVLGIPATPYRTTVATNVVLNVLLIPHYGLIGAGLATAIALFASALWLMRMSRSLVGVRLY